MFTKKGYSIAQMAIWTKRETFIFLLVSIFPTALYDILGFTWINLPWLPIALIGTAVAFIIGFRNNVTYDRIWEARKIWGGIVNTSRTWGMMVIDTVTNEYCKSPLTSEELKREHTTLIHRHIAWMTALRHAMRTRKTWETFLDWKSNRAWYDMMHIPERDFEMEQEIENLLSEEEKKIIAGKTNKATALLKLQSTHIRKLKEQGVIWEFSFLELEGVLKDLFDLQGKSERIKNFPYPRQYATLNHFFVWIFIFLLPFGVIPEFDRIGNSFSENFPLIGDYFVWLAVPFAGIVSWVFHTMERIGQVGENPFEGSANDVPISTIARGIEIDLREMLEEDEIPEPLPSVYGVQM